MNQLTVQQRKMVYAAVAVLALVPIIVLGAPAGRSEGSGWFLAQSRSKYELGEASLGNVDPTSATMNLVLLGLRGVAASVLWMQADHYKDTKNFNQLEETVESIILLQPHFKAVWEYQAWNLAFNVSAECDAVQDRFFWVKRGAKFLTRGSRRNEKVPELKFELGRFFGQKIGRADESEVFREFFLVDPDEERWRGGPDEEINPDGKDNYLVAADWYQRANQAVEEPGVTQHKMDLALFVAYPYRSLMDYARAKQRDGVQADLDAMSEEQRSQAYQEWAASNRASWEDAYEQWTGIYGRAHLETSGGGTIVLENDEQGLRELQAMAEKDGMEFEGKRRWQEQYRKMTSYPYWKKHADIEKRETMMQARYQLAEGRRLFRNVQDFEGARRFLEQGMTNLQSVIDEYETTEGTNALLIDEEEIVEDAIKALLMWRQVLTLLGEPVPEEYPLQQIWNSPEGGIQQLREELQQRFLLWQG